MRYYHEREENPIFHREKLTLFQWITVASNVLIGAVLLNWPWQAKANESTWLFVYILLTHVLFYVFHRQFKNVNLFLLWIAVGTIHLWMSKMLEGEFQLLSMKFQYTIPMLLLLQALRLLSYGVIRGDFGIMSKFSSTDIDTGRRLNLLDILIFLAYFGLGTYLPLNYRLF